MISSLWWHTEFLHMGTLPFTLKGASSRRLVLSIFPPICLMGRKDTSSEYCPPVRCAVQYTVHEKSSVFPKFYQTKLALYNLQETASYKAKDSQ